MERSSSDIQVCTGADTEMIYPPGGEAAFIAQMVDESERYALKCRYVISLSRGALFSKINIVVKMVYLHGGQIGNNV